MATVFISLEVALKLCNLIDSIKSGEFTSGQFSVMDKRGIPFELVIFDVGSEKRNA